MFNNAYRGKKVLITGNTGFKGSWLTCWLLNLQAEVIGLSKDIPTEPSMFETLGLENKITHYMKDMRSLENVQDIIMRHKPDFVFHLAAQALVSVSYSDPVETFSSNVMGTVNILQALKESNHPCCAVMITSDKCYDNVEWEWGYKETDTLGGKDIYSGSKGAAELAIKSYFHSFFCDENSNIRLAVGRAGNVIGGGDWAKDRIVADCIKAWQGGSAVEIRSPQATRPWQHVLEPLSGYLALGEALHSDKKLHGEAFNFGPRTEQTHTVVQLLEALAERWGFENINDAFKVTDNIPFHEAGLLKLNCDKAHFHLKWLSNLSFEETADFVSDWYAGYYKSKADMYELTVRQIEDYTSEAVNKNIPWCT